ncbi:MAG: hypothetical protein D4S02_01590 [Rhodocyclaceae bacterium]|nr:MAG: hypothetical protein D4S02_01590 [Rhodocyclaceae bacterium]
MKRLFQIVVIGWLGLGNPVLALDPPVLTAKTSGLTISLSWTSVSGATGYSLYYAPYPYAGPNTIGSVDLGVTTKLSADLWVGASYYLAVTSYDKAGLVAYSNVELITITSDKPAGPSPTDTVAFAKAMVPGAWAYAGYSCSKQPDPRIQASYFICPAGGLRGVEDTYISGKKYSYVAKGTWSTASTPSNPSFASLLLKYTTTVNVGGVVDSGPGLLGGKSGYMLYDASADTIAYYYNSCWMVMKRLADGSNIGVDDSYCQSSGTATSQCQADYDCGRCFYCDKSAAGNTCRYGGEGPYGCYRGWSP